jgi:glyoxylase-like metal-dependent hydrolase (beta-lactamase superfamily II)
MIEEIAQNIYRITIQLPNSPLKELNSYFIHGTDHDLLIDTGFRCPECRASMETSLSELGSNSAQRDVLITHLHADHSGLADVFVGPDRKIYMSNIDLRYNSDLVRGKIDTTCRERFIQEGFPAALLDYIQTLNPAKVMALPQITNQFHGLNDGDMITVGSYHLQVILVPGHTPGNIMLWEENHGIMFSGDHVLFDITPNITAWPTVEDALGQYLMSLRKAQAFPVRQTFPGHRETGDYGVRIRALLNHHEVRLKEVLRIIAHRPNHTAYEIASHMTWKIRARNWDDFPPVQKWFAVGECLAHLEHLEKLNKLQRRWNGNAWRFSLASEDCID